MLIAVLVVIALLHNACASIHLGEVEEFKSNSVRVSCGEANDLESASQTIVSCVFENPTEQRQSIAVTSVNVKQGDDTYAALDQEACLGAINAYLSRRGLSGSTVAMGTVMAVGGAYNSNSGAAVAGGATGMALSEVDDRERVRILRTEFGTDYALTEDFELDPRKHRVRRGVFSYGMSDRGNRDLEICIGSNQECVVVPLNSVAVLRKRG